MSPGYGNKGWRIECEKQVSVSLVMIYMKLLVISNCNNTNKNKICPTSHPLSKSTEHVHESDSTKHMNNNTRL